MNTASDNLCVSQFVQGILTQAVQERASDIHFEPSYDSLTIRYRKDGTFFDLPSAPSSLTSHIFAHLKSLANLNVSDTHLPQDGRISLDFNNSHYNFRLATTPTGSGESLVLRVLDAAAHLNIDQLGMPEAIREDVLDLTQSSSGFFIITGPTGSGKTTTLYSILKEILSPKKKYLTVEDPVEFIIPGTTQVAVNEAIGLTFAKTLRSFLRHDPDVLMIGEIRDLETAQIAVQASLTGHLVLTTLHTNNAPSAITRLIDLGLDPSLIATTLRGVLGQRLIRTHCTACEGRGCPSCNESGYLGRTAIFELMKSTPDLRSLISKTPTAQALVDQAQQDGYSPLVIEE